MKAQVLYDLREKYEFCSGTDLHEFFAAHLKGGDPSPSGKVELPFRSGETFVQECLRVMTENSPSLVEHIGKCWKAFQVASKSTHQCVCEYKNRSAMTRRQWEAADGHWNQAGGYCCPHHGNTCGHCHDHDGPPKGTK